MSLVVAVYHMAWHHCQRNRWRRNPQARTQRQLSPGMWEAILVLLKYYSKDILLKRQWPSFDPGGQKAVNRIYSTSLILRW